MDFSNLEQYVIGIHLSTNLSNKVYAALFIHKVTDKLKIRKIKPSCCFSMFIIGYNSTDGLSAYQRHVLCLDHN